MLSFGKRGTPQSERNTPPQPGPPTWVYVLALAGTASLIAFLFLKPSTQQTDNTFACELGTPANGTVVGVLGADGHPLLQSPNGPKIINRKATEMLGETHYQIIDNSTSVQLQCNVGNWTRVQITEPEWLRAHVGWVERSSLDERGSPDGFRTFTDEHFHWGKDTVKAKDAIIKAVNRLHRDDARCANSIVPASVAKSTTESARKGTSVYFINCGSGNSLVNVYFDAE